MEDQRCTWLPGCDNLVISGYLCPRHNREHREMERDQEMLKKHLDNLLEFARLMEEN